MATVKRLLKIKGGKFRYYHISTKNFKRYKKATPHRPRTLARKYGKRVRVYQKEIKNYAVTIITAFDTKKNSSKDFHWEDSAFEIWVRGLVIKKEPETRKEFLKVFGELVDDFDAEFKRKKENNSLHWLYFLSQKDPVRSNPIGPYWGVEIEKTRASLSLFVDTTVYRISSNGDRTTYDEVGDCNQKLRLTWIGGRLRII